MVVGSSLRKLMPKGDSITRLKRAPSGIASLLRVLMLSVSWNQVLSSSARVRERLVGCKP